MQATYELVDGEGETRESIAELFREARKDLEFALSGPTANNLIAVTRRLRRLLKRMRLAISPPIR